MKKYKTIRELVQNNNTIQNSFVLIMTGLMVLFLTFSFKDLAFVYGVAHKNYEVVKQDENIIKLVELESEKSGNYKVTTTEGTEKTIEKPEVSYVMNNKKHLSYYSEEDNMLLVPVDDEFIRNMVFGNSSTLVLATWSIMTVMLIYACFKKTFTVLSQKRVSAVFVLLELVLLSYIGIAFWMFN